MSQRTCSVDECTGKHWGHGFCNMHYNRWRRHGDPLVTLTGHGSINAHGYRSIAAHGHPVASKNGRAYEHRVVLYDNIGPGEHRCHWCSTPVSWDALQHTPGYLTADHLDFDRKHNAPSNLVPSCVSCNMARHKYEMRRDTETGRWLPAA